VHYGVGVNGVSLKASTSDTRWIWQKRVFVGQSSDWVRWPTFYTWRKRWITRHLSFGSQTVVAKVSFFQS